MMQRSFSSMLTMAQRCSKQLASFQQEQSRLPKLHVFVVGTRKDQLIKEGRLDEATKDITTFLEELDGKPYYHSIEWDSSTGKPFSLLIPWLMRMTEYLSAIYVSASPARNPLSSLMSRWCGSSVRKSLAALRRSSSGSMTWRLSAGSISLLMARMHTASFVLYCSCSPSSASFLSSTSKVSQTRTTLSAPTQECS